jgi:hypothetical protein
MQLVNNETHIIRYPEQSTFLCIYFSVCDLPDLKSSTFYVTPHTPANLSTFASDHPAPYADLILSTQRKYKPVATKVCPVLGDLPEKFRIEREIIGNPFDDLPVLYPDSLPFVTTNLYTLARQHQPHKNYPGSFRWPVDKDLMQYFMLAHALGFTWHEEKRGSFRADFFLLVNLPFTPHTPWVECIFPSFPRYYQHRRHSPSRNEAQFGSRQRRRKYLLQPPRSDHQIERPYLSLFLLSHFIIFLYLISPLLYIRHDIAVFFITRDPSYTGL